MIFAENRQVEKRAVCKREGSVIVKNASCEFPKLEFRVTNSRFGLYSTS